jgi:hypothetical protein
MHDLAAFELLVRAHERIILDAGGLFALVFGSILLARHSLERAKFDLEIQPNLQNAQALSDYRFKLNMDLSVSVALAIIGAIILIVSLVRSATFNVKDFLQEQTQLVTPTAASGPGKSESAASAASPVTQGGSLTTTTTHVRTESHELSGSYAPEEPADWIRELGTYISTAPDANEKSSSTKTHAEAFFLTLLHDVQNDNQIAMALATSTSPDDRSTTAALAFTKAIDEYFRELSDRSHGDPKERYRRATNAMTNLKSARDQLLQAAREKGLISK